jgi:hypothetical protein
MPLCGDLLTGIESKNRDAGFLKDFLLARVDWLKSQNSNFDQVQHWVPFGRTDQPVASL